MMEGGRSASLVTASQIAALAEVGSSAVSNWRRRFEDFPPAIQTAPGGRDLFELEEVERWLERHGRSQESRGKRLLFAAADQLRSEVSARQMIEVLGAALALIAVEGRRAGPPPAGAAGVESLMLAASTAEPDLNQAFQPLLEINRSTAEDVLRFLLGIDEQQLPECFEWILSRGQGPYDAQSDSGSSLTGLIEAIAEDIGGVVYDPAAGWGGFLLALWRKGRDQQPPRLFGQELTTSSATIARQRFLVENTPISLALGNTLTEDAWPELRADVIVSDPPYGVKVSWPVSAEGDPRWISGRPPAMSDFAWLQHVIHHLKEEGQGYVFLSTSTLFRRGKDANLRRELLTEGVVEGIVGLPPGSVPRASIPVALWILRKHRSGSNPGSVLMVDATAGDPSPRGPLGEEMISRIAESLRRWRAGLPIPASERSLAASVPVIDLLRQDANLEPARWMSAELTIADRDRQQKEFRAAKQTLEKARSALAATPETPRALVTHEPRAWIEIDQLLDDRVAQIIGGVRIKDEDCLPTGIPVLRLRDLGGESLDESSCFVDPAAMKPRPQLTHPGDIIIAPKGGRLRAVVDRTGGRVIAAPLQALRLLDGFVEPVLAAAFLESPRNRRLLGSARTNVRLRDLEIPLLPRSDSRELLKQLEELEGQRQLAEQICSSAERLRELLLSLASSSPGPRS